MLVNAFMPAIEFCIAYTVASLKRRYDRRGGKDEFHTHKMSIQLYIELYSGPEYMIHFKYSLVMNIAFVCMMYGLGIPFLFLIASISYWVLYTVERLCVAYFYQLPPTFDDKLTKNAVGLLKWASILYLFFGYWMISNKQAFGGVINKMYDT